MTVAQASIGVSLSNPENTIAAYVGGDAAAFDAAAGVNNAHVYPPYEANLDDGAGRQGVIGDYVIGTQTGFNNNTTPVLVSEYHPTIGNTQGHANDTARDAYYAPMFLLSANRHWSIAGIFWWALFDYGSGLPPGGLFATDVSTPRPAAYALRAMYALTGDGNAGLKRSFTPGQLDYTVTGLPSPINGASPYTGGQHALYQNSAGTYFLFVWNAQDAPGGAATPVAVRFNSHAMTRVVEYDLTSAPSVAQSALQTVSPCSQITMQLAAAVRLLVITY